MELHNRRKVMLCYDNSPQAKKLVPWAIENVLMSGKDHCVIVSVITDDYSAWLSEGNIENANDADYLRTCVSEIRNRGEEVLNRIAKEIRDKKDVTTQVVILHGDPREEIMNYAKDAHVNLMVVSSRGLGYFERKLLGSVSEYAIRHASCSVVVAKLH
ncbi:uncharacterized protein VTP21DRAFT_10288 [Calcarisporiella thermophila]|uniref:uncharacterized protein n=1 Tax=Calcarisporiella thermophila TaxID=911321 RepID=UPI0037441BC3